MKRIYIAGPYSADNTIQTLRNIGKGIQVGIELLLKGYAIFCPWLDYSMFLQLRANENIPLELIQQHSLSWLKVSNALFVLPNSENSIGTQKEIEYAIKHNIPIYYSLKELENDSISK